MKLDVGARIRKNQAPRKPSHGGNDHEKGSERVQAKTPVLSIQQRV